MRLNKELEALIRERNVAWAIAVMGWGAAAMLYFT